MSFNRQLRRKRITLFSKGHLVKINIYTFGNFTRAMITCENCSCKYEAEYKIVDKYKSRNINILTNKVLKEAKDEFLKLPSCVEQYNVDTINEVMNS